MELQRIKVGGLKVGGLQKLHSWTSLELEICSSKVNYYFSSGMKDQCLNGNLTGLSRSNAGQILNS